MAVRQYLSTPQRNPRRDNDGELLLRFGWESVERWVAAAGATTRRTNSLRGPAAYTVDDAGNRLTRTNPQVRARRGSQLLVFGQLDLFDSFSNL